MPKLVTHEDFVARATAKHEGRYSYPAPYQAAILPLAIQCPEHGLFEQRPANHLQGAGCPKCAGRHWDWLARFQSVHGDTYDYSKVVFEYYKTKVIIGCRIHGDFIQTPDAHYNGRTGCPKCKGDRIRVAKQLPIEEFIRRASIVHRNRFMYEVVQFTNLLTGLVKVCCPLHGVFTITPVNHLAGNGCSNCGQKSSEEAYLARFLSLFLRVSHRDRKVLAPKELDIYLPDKNLAIEYCGMYWHSHFSKEDEKKDKLKHYQKYIACAAKGIRLITIYESEWLNNPQAIIRLIRNAVGITRGKLMARKCILRKVGIADARNFYDLYHPQGGSGSGEHYGLFWNKTLVACMRFSFGNNDRGIGAAKRVWTLSRYATRATVAGAASRLFKAFVQEHNPQEVKSFSDNRYFSGGMYIQLGFVLEEEVAPDYQVWSQKLGLFPKAHYQRRAIPKRLRQHGLMDEKFDPETDPRTEADMTFLMGCGRIYDCGKKRWVWTPRTLDSSSL